MRVVARGFLGRAMGMYGPNQTRLPMSFLGAVVC